MDKSIVSFAEAECFETWVLACVVFKIQTVIKSSISNQAAVLWALTKV